VRQVLIEARIVEADDKFSRNLGAKLGFNDLSSTVYRTVGVTDPVTGTAPRYNVPVYGAGSKVLGNYGDPLGQPERRHRPVVAERQRADGINAQGLGRLTATQQHQLRQPAGVRDQRILAGVVRGQPVRLVADAVPEPGVVGPRGRSARQGRVEPACADRRPEQGDDRAGHGVAVSSQATSSGASAIQFRKASLKLEVTPQITPEGNVIMEVSVNRDAVGILTPPAMRSIHAR
jgi:type IV pilus assembly protein PilQ